MRNTLLSAGLILSGWVALVPPALSFEIEVQTLFEVPNASETIDIISTADTDSFAPLIVAFQDRYPDTAVNYVTVSSAELMTALQDERESFDLAISSAMDLQTKLSNDGLTLSHNSDATELVPDWAKWRDQVFAFTQEPAAIVVSKSAFDGLELPRTRQDMISLMRSQPDRFRGRVGTYDIRVSGLGYLFATQDARTSETYWRLMETMGNLSPRLYCCSSDMFDDVQSGKLAVAYNVLGSYAQARTDSNGTIDVIEPHDFTTVMLRSAVIPTYADNPDLGGSFLDHLIRSSWSTEGESYYPFPPMPPELDPDRSSLRPIRLGPGLLVYLDQYKRARLLSEWEDAVIQR
ncbi:MAG: ABC transporter substrate-binding protein [Paracoccaceae bacterium]